MVTGEIVVVGAGPAGLCFARMAGLAMRGCRVVVLERDGPDDSYGFGVSLSERTLRELARHDPQTHRRIAEASVNISGLEIRLPAGAVRYDGFGFATISRRALLTILREQAIDAGASIQFRREAGPVFGAGPGLIAFADGAASVNRSARRQEYGTSESTGSARFIWLGTGADFKDTATFIFVLTEYGPMAAHAYSCGAGLSTVVVELGELAWRSAGFAADGAGPVSDRALAALSRIFAGHLGGHPLISNRSRWSRFTTVRNARWSHRNTVLLGDAAHTAHFTVGSGTKLALEDGIALAAALLAADGYADAFAAYERARRGPVTRTQSLAGPSMGWWETYGTRLHLRPEQFGLHFLTRTGALGYLTLRAQCGKRMEEAEERFRADAGLSAAAPAGNAIGVPFTPGAMRLPSRLAAVVPPSFAELRCPPEPEWTLLADDLVSKAARLRELGQRGVLLRASHLAGPARTLAEWTHLLRHASRIRFEAGLAVAVQVPADWALDLMKDARTDNWATRIHLALVSGRIDLVVTWPG